MKINPLAGRNLVGIDDLSKQEIILLLDQTDRIRQEIAQKRPLALLQGYVLATLFYEPSTRTRLSFESAMHRVGGSVISVADAGSTSSAVKGESIGDAVRTVSGYADVIVQRHPAAGSAQEAAEAATIPLINAGDGAGEHPTQALLDLYTIRQERGHLEGLTVAMVGDLKHGRTVHSLARALTHWQTSLLFVSPPTLAMPSDLVANLRSKGSDVSEIDDVQEAVRAADVLYVVRIQKERFADPAEFERVRGSYVVDRALLSQGNQGITVMHPLPRVDELAPDVDNLPNAAYFRQTANGVWTRAALLALILDNPL